MPHKITFMPDQSSFECQQKENILESALRSGQSPDYGCSNGNCGHCKAKLLEGQIIPTRNFDHKLSIQDKEDAIFLMCCHGAASDLVIEVKTAHAHTDIAMQTTTAKIKKIQTDATGIMLIPLQTPRTGTLRFLAGQTIEILNTTGSLGHYYIGSCPCDDRNLLIHVPENIDITTEEEKLAAVDCFQTGRQVIIYGPQGNCTLEETPPRPALMIAEEHAFSAVKSLIEHAIALEYNQTITLVRFSKFSPPYLHNLCRSWNDALDDFNYIFIEASDKATTQTTSFALPELQALLEKEKSTVIYIAGTQKFCNSWVQDINQFAEKPLVKYAPLKQ